MSLIDDVFVYLKPYEEIIQLFVVIIISFVIFSLLLRLVKKRLLKKVKTKKQKSNVTVFIDMLKYIFAFFLLIIVIAFYSGKLGDLGFVAGLLTVALGWALQKPISGVVAWLILATRRPFHIGDRVIISNIKGDITNITLTHIYLDEVGGTIDGEENSGRTVMIPTSIIFEQEVINYSEKDDYILDEIIFTVTYESNLKKSEEIAKDSVRFIMKELWEGFPKRISQDAHTRLMFKDSGVNVVVRYNTIANRRNGIATDIRREIWNKVTKTADVEFAYPHTEVLFREKNKSKN